MPAKILAFRLAGTEPGTEHLIRTLRGNILLLHVGCRTCRTMDHLLILFKLCILWICIEMRPDFHLFLT